MILHTTVPYELVFPQEAQMSDMRQTISWQGVEVLVERSGQQMKIIRVLSTNPYDYLNESLLPGQMISL
ncbi:MAG TPA: YlzJ-like family protein [Chondromyces sp.]|nr:YlzJ-like family protein [Chondromyces sp.]